MINATVIDIRQSLQEVSGRDLSHVPEVELRYFLEALAGPFTAEDWKRMPTLFRELTEGRTCACPDCRQQTRRR